MSCLCSRTSECSFTFRARRMNLSTRSRGSIAGIATTVEKGPDNPRVNFLLLANRAGAQHFRHRRASARLVRGDVATVPLPALQYPTVAVPLHDGRREGDHSSGFLDSGRSPPRWSR
jgi:hypothetical protein